MASNRIKGITIKIGGDTTDLNKALEGTNKKISSTQTQLKDVERLLKLDPKNVTLLEQKQRLLAAATEETSKKLEALKKASAQAAKSAENYDAWKAAYDPIQSEIDQTKQKLKALRDEQKELADSGQIDTDAYKELSEQAKKCYNDLKDLKNQVRRVSDEFGNPISTSQYDALQREIADTENKLKDLRGEAKKAGDSLEDIGDVDGGGLDFGDVLGANLITEGADAIIEALGDIVEETKEYRKIMASLEQSSKQAGYTVEETAASYEKFYGVLADDQSSATALANLQALEAPQETLMKLIDGTIGAWAKYGDSIPIDGLAEAINHTAKLGEVQGTFADVLEWNGVTVDDFNALLAECSTEEKRLQLIMDEMTRQNLPSMGRAWQENNESLTESNKANARLQEQMARLAETIEPLFTAMTNAAAWVLEKFNDLTDAVQENGVSFDSTAMSVAAATGDFSVLADHALYLTEKTDETTEALGEYDDQLEETGEGQGELDTAVEGTISEMEKLRQEYADAKEAARESIDSQIGLFDELSKEAEMTTEDIVANWLDQQSAFDNYAVNLQKAVDMGLDQALIKQLADGSEESMLILNEFVNGTETSIDEINAAFQGLNEARDIASEAMESVTTGITAEIQKAEAEVYVASYELGAQAAAGASAGVNDNAGKYSSSMSSMATGGTKAFKNAMSIRSPSRVMIDANEDVVAGAVLGVERNVADYEAALADLAKAGELAFMERSLDTVGAFPTSVPTESIHNSTAYTSNFGGITMQIYQQTGEDMEAFAHRTLELMQMEIERREATLQ